MPKINVVDMNGKIVGDINLSDAVFAIEPNKTVMHSVVINYLANQRQGTQSTLTRTEVRGGGRKPWKQKGTGHARQGSIRAPQWRHGGVALGPKPRSYAYTLNKKVRKLAIKSALSSKVLENNIIVVDKIEFSDFKTKDAIKMFKALGVDKKALVVLTVPSQTAIKSMANVPGVKTTLVNTLSVYDMLGYDKFIIVKDACLKLEEVYS